MLKKRIVFKKNAKNREMDPLDPPPHASGQGIFWDFLYVNQGTTPYTFPLKLELHDLLFFSP